jgi:hypothetical protein
MRFPRRHLAPFVVILAVLGSGCDGRPSIDSSTTEATVTGIVMLKGKPATSGEIFFNPANVDRQVGARSAPIGPDGTYTIKTYTGGIQIGFGGSLVSENPGLFRFKQYYEVQRGENKKDFDLLSSSQPGSGLTKAQSSDSQTGGGPTKSFGKKQRYSESGK